MEAIGSVRADSAALLLLIMTLKASLILGAAWLGAALIRRGSAAARHLLWCSAIVAALALPLCARLLPVWSIPLVASPVSEPQPVPGLAPPSSFQTSTSFRASTGPDGGLKTADEGLVAHEAAAIPSDSADTPAVASDQPRTMPSSAPLVVPTIAASAELASSSSPIVWSASVIFLAIWMVGMLTVLARLGLGLARVSWIAARSATLADPAWQTLTATVARELELPRSIRLLRGGKATMPMAWGVTAPVLLLPADTDGWSIERRRAVLLHELAHVKRGDCLTQGLAHVMCAVYWFTPFSWIASARLRAERERACDDLVLAAGIKPPDYADHLLQIAGSFRSAACPSWAALAVARPSQLEGRLLAILDRQRSRRAPTRYAFGLVGALFGVVMLPLAAMQPWVTASTDIQESQPAPQSTTRVNPLPAPRPDPAAAPEANPMPVPVPNPASSPFGPLPFEPRMETGPPASWSALAAGPPAPTAVSDAPTSEALPLGRAWPTDELTDRTYPLLSGSRDPKAETLAGQDKNASSSPGRERDTRALVNALMSALEDPDADVRQQALQTLVRLRDPGAIGGLTAALKDETPSVRQQAASGLSQFRSEAATGGLLLALQDEDSEVRQQAAAGLGKLRDPRVVDALVAALEDPDAGVRQQVVEALAQLRAASTLGPLTIALRDSDPEVRSHAAHSLGQLRSTAAVEPLMAMIKDPDDDVRQHVVFALGQIKDPRAVEALAVAVADRNGEVRQKATFALGQLRDPRAVDPLIRALSDSDPDVRQHAAFALGQVRDPRAAEPLARALTDTDSDVRQHAAFALGQLRATAGVPALIAALKDRDEDVREHAVFALGQIRDDRAIDPLTALLRDPEAEVRQKAAFALGQLARPRKGGGDGAKSGGVTRSKGK